MFPVKLRWRNVPLPEAYLVALGGGGALEFLHPHAITSTSSSTRVGGALVGSAGLGLALWSVAAAGETTIDTPDVLLVSGPYRHSRNPMYLAWTLIAVGVALLLNSAWLLGMVPLSILFIHLVEIPREEAQLGAVFGDEYLKYKGRVRRYL